MERKNDKISVIIPIYNVEPYLRQCLDSVVNQTYKNLEIILVDDGSPDNCGAICDEYARKDARIMVIHKQNGGASAARNDGIDRAAGEWVTFVDPDDWLDVDFYEHLFDEMRDQDVDILCAGGCFQEYGNNKIVSRAFIGRTLFEKREQIDFLMAKTLGANCENPIAHIVSGPVAPWNKLYKRSFLLQNHLKFDTELHPWEDILFNFCAYDKANRIAASNYIGYHYRQQVSTSITTRFNSNIPKMYIAFINRLNDYMRHMETSKLIQDVIGVAPILSFAFAARCYYFHKDNPNPYRVTADEIKELKREPALHAAIHGNNNQYLTKEKIVLKYLLRLPWIWPLKLACGVKQMLPKK